MKHLLTFLFVFSIPVFLTAQYLEVGAKVGTTAYIGELSDQRFPTNGYHAAFGVFARYNFNPHFSAKAKLTKYAISGDDANANQLVFKERNLSFRSDIIEFALTGEINLMPFNIRANQAGVPYFATGISLIHFNPQAQFNGEWHDLEPLHTEGAGYKKMGVAIPLALGFKFNVSYKWNFGVEIGYRKTFTDKLDDISGYYPDIIAMRADNHLGAALSYRSPEFTGEFGSNPVGQERGNPEDNDSFFYAALTVSVNLTDKYGLDFDKKYEMFKSKPEKELTPYEKAKLRKKQRVKAKHKKTDYLKRQAKKARKKGKKTDLQLPPKKRLRKDMKEEN